jgi:hypothetical protein
MRTAPALLAITVAVGAAGAAAADREDGIPTSLLGTYIRANELLVYPFYEYTRHNKFEYKPSELGVQGPGNQDEFLGKTVEREYLLFVAYAFSDSLALEFESALHSSLEFTKAGNDPTGTPATLRESGLGDTEINLRWRFARETATRSEYTFFLKTVFPLQKDKHLLGSRDWEIEPGLMATKSYPWGVFAVRAAIGWTSSERKLDLAEWAIDYVKQLTPQWRLALSLEGNQADEVSAIGELQYAIGRKAVLKMNLGIGLTEKAANVAPEIGILFRF